MLIPKVAAVVVVVVGGGGGGGGGGVRQVRLHPFFVVRVHGCDLPVIYPLLVQPHTAGI